MAGAALKIISLVAGIVSQTGILDNKLPPKIDYQHVVRIGVGTSINTKDSTGKCTPAIALFDN
jgi:hypothetical protein